ncbi:MAG: hypothetical protein LBU88_02520 [Treponema sp.]|jgi:hypothetical protein|nr:hypothetical protein [Treponema sp.]
MSILRSVLVSCLISLLAGIVLFFIGSAAGYEQFKGGYAILSFDSSLEDRELRQLLDSGRAFFGGLPISESSAWVMLDNFGSLEQVPLDTYNSRVLPFDPRNDGYAEKLREFFIRDGKRYIYVPLIAGNWKDNFLDKQFTNLMQGIPYSSNYYGVGKPLTLFFTVYGISSLALFILCLVRKNMHLRIVNILTLIPLFSSLSFFGAEGIAAASILFGAFFLLREPLYELASMPGLYSGIANRAFRSVLKTKFYKEMYQPYKTYWKSLIFFLLALVLLVVFTPLKPLFLVVLFFASLAVFFASSRIISVRAPRHLNDNNSGRRFSPVAIMKKSKPEFAFFVYMLPFAIGALTALVFTPFFPDSHYIDQKYANIINEDDYITHIKYQAAFSTTKLGTNISAYYDYTAGNDGLPSLSQTARNQSINLNDYPSFPLKHLIDFLNNVNND